MSAPMATAQSAAVLGQAVRSRTSVLRRAAAILALLAGIWAGSPAFAQGAPPANAAPTPAAANAAAALSFLEDGAPSAPQPNGATEQLSQTSPFWEDTLGGDLTHPERIGGVLKVLVSLAVFSLAPALLLMTTSYVRLAVVLALLRQAIGSQQAPPHQVMTALAMFMTLLIMAPVWQTSYREGLEPYMQHDSSMSFETAWERGVLPVRRFMSRQIQNAGNSEDVWLFYNYLPAEQRESTPQSYDDVPLQVLLPAFLMSELKTAFLIGFQVYLPFLILDLVVASVTSSMGLVALPPATVAFPLKLMLFVLVDGWRLIVGMLLDSFAWAL